MFAAIYPMVQSAAVGMAAAQALNTTYSGHYDTRAATDEEEVPFDTVYDLENDIEILGERQVPWTHDNSKF